LKNDFAGIIMILRRMFHWKDATSGYSWSHER